MRFQLGKVNQGGVSLFSIMLKQEKQNNEYMSEELKFQYIK